MAAAAAGSHGRALAAATASNGKTGMTGQTSHGEVMQRASDGKIGATMIGGQVTATRIRTPGQASNGKHGKIGPKRMTASIGLSSLTVGQTGLLHPRLTGVWFEGGRACKGEN